MEAIKAIAKKTKTGKYKIDLPINNNADEVEVMVIVEQKKTKSKKTLADFAGKLHWKGDAVAYQKMLRDEWQ
jgi:IS30 family transposase